MRHLWISDWSVIKRLIDNSQINHKVADESQIQQCITELTECEMNNKLTTCSHGWGWSIIFTYCSWMVTWPDKFVLWNVDCYVKKYELDIQFEGKFVVSSNILLDKPCLVCWFLYCNFSKRLSYLNFPWAKWAKCSVTKGLNDAR